MTENNHLAPFFNWKQENTNNGYETMQDFFLSWTIRCSEERHATVDPLLNEYCKRLVFTFLFGENDDTQIYKPELFEDNFQVILTRTIRQEHRIDLIAELTVLKNGCEEKYVLNIENKWYSSLKDHQLNDSKEYIEKKYPGYKYRHFIVFCDHEMLNQSMISSIKKQTFNFITIDDLREIAGINRNGATGNYLFDEYWIRDIAKQ